MSVIAFAESELKRINFGEHDTKVMVEIMEKFFDTWDSGGAVWAVFPILQRCIACKPLSPLTGEDDEWNEVGPSIWQNRRCPTVFKDKDGRPYDIDTPGRPTITFPYMPDKADVRSPVMTIG